MTIDQALYALEEVMHAQLDQPVKGDFMSLTRAWRGVLEELIDEFEISGRATSGFLTNSSGTGILDGGDGAEDTPSRTPPAEPTSTK